jgi:hypothetical protein
MANKKISELQSRTPSLSDLLLVGDPSSGYSYKCTVTDLATIIETDIADGYVTIGTTQTISGAKTFSNNLTLTSVSNANTDTDKFLVLNASNIVNFRTGAEVLSDIGGQGALTLTTTGTSGAATLVSNVLNIPQYQGVISLASIGSSPNANGATLSSNTLTLQPASGSFGGVVTTGFQEFAGQKRFIGNPIQFDKHLEVKNIDSWGVSWGYTSLASKDTPVFGFLRGHSFVGTVTYYAWFTYGSTGERNYTLPSTDGTLALTSDITSSISGTTNYIPKFTGSNSIGNSVIYESSSNIGIGTTSPGAKLEIEGSEYIKTGNELRFYRTDNAIYTTLYDAGSTAANGFILNNTNGEGFHFKNGSTTIMRMNSSNNVGIGTTSPSDKLHVYQNADDNVVGKFEQAFSSRGDLLQFTNAHGTGYVGHAGDASGDFSILNASNTNTYFTTNGTERMRITSTGNVGIGTTAPETLLHINSSNAGGEGGYIFIDNPAASTAGNKAGIKFGTSSGASFSTVPTGEITNVIDNAGTGASALTFGTFNGTASGERMRITSGGLVGIGTTTPESYYSGADNLVVAQGSGDGGITIATANNTTGALYFADGTTGTEPYRGGIAYTHSIDVLTLVSGGAEKVRITSGGDVGIGVTSPAEKLTVAGNIFANAGNGEGFKLNGGLSIYRLAGDDLGFYTASTERMRITSGGNVGIGTTSPTAISNYIALTINGTSGSFTEYQENGGRAFRIGSDGATGGFISQTSADPIRIFTSSTERMRITSEGLVLIGTTSTSGVDVVRINKNGTTEYSTLNVTNSNSTAVAYFGVGGSNVANTNLRNNAYLWNAANSSLVFGTNDTLRVTIKNTGVVNISNIPTSATGLAAGDIWSDGGTLKIV